MGDYRLQFSTCPRKKIEELSKDRGIYFSYERTEEGCQCVACLYIPLDEQLVTTLGLRMAPVDRSKLSYALISVKKRNFPCSGIVSSVVGAGHPGSVPASDAIEAKTQGMEKYFIRRISAHLGLNEEEIRPAASGERGSIRDGDLRGEDH